MIALMDTTAQASIGILNYYRKTRRLTQAEMADFIQCSRQRYGRLEKFESRPAHQEWLRFMEGARLPVIDRPAPSLNFYDYPQAQFLIPMHLRGSGFLSGRIGGFFLSLTRSVLGNKIETICRREGIDPIYFVNQANPMPYILFFRLIQEMKLRGHWNRQSELSGLVETILTQPEWWGGRWKAFKKMDEATRFRTLVLEWCEYSRNHRVQVVKDGELTRGGWFIKIKPLAHIDKKLYFRDPIIGNFFGDFLAEFGRQLLGRQAASQVEQVGGEWCLYLVNP